MLQGGGKVYWGSIKGNNGVFIMITMYSLKSNIAILKSADKGAELDKNHPQGVNPDPERQHSMCSLLSGY